mmetsp:Transcript_28621/g.39932  ORF Transcript_28621/g.39932 Transcript_28621/m.39932 type:complete len:223 (-) Transcript_28621:274-942(-)|eukprot:CAMPEP_0185268630 /NCGR_PEP_ID=MMETSP1359-20130426/37538_1 /TAXON_ID=552665 /ORGANISM="Bigelowiella longifila, Strain CCMP242" /LENGTH=222 /DNA_ID=CAMNT_0027859453 /DNA_START=49 /DNA_END=717 /DNA_ORIENTATION=+
MLSLSLLVVVPLLLRADQPNPSEQFTCRLVEVDDTQGGVITLNETLVEDPINRRSRMVADGPLLSGGHLEQIRRCDIEPEGYFIDIQGAADTAPSSWTCRNESVDPSPSTCQWSKFWDIPANATSNGTTLIINGEEAVAWTYWDDGAKFSFYATPNGSVPLRIAKLSVTSPEQHLWHYDIFDFRPGKPDISLFDPTPGVVCSDEVVKNIGEQDHSPDLKDMA